MQNVYSFFFRLFLNVPFSFAKLDFPSPFREIHAAESFLRVVKYCAWSGSKIEHAAAQSKS